jgi:hypothetical protein
MLAKKTVDDRSNEGEDRPYRILSEVDCAPGGYANSREALDALLGAIDAIPRAADAAREERELIREIGECANQEQLFAQFAKRRRDTDAWLRFVETVLLLPEECWEKAGGGLEEKLVVKLVTGDWDGFTHIVRPRSAASKAIRANLTTSTYPLYGVIDFTPCWRTHAERYIKAGDFDRAWEAIRRAHRGFFIANLEEDAKEAWNYKQFRANPNHRCCQADRGVLRELVSNLFEVMIRAEIIHTLEDVDYLAPVDRFERVVWEGPKDRKHRRVISVENRYPSKALIMAMGGTYVQTRRGKYRVRGAIRTPRAVTERFCELSAEANKIARHFHAKQQAKRAAKRADAS